MKTSRVATVSLLIAASGLVAIAPAASAASPKAVLSDAFDATVTAALSQGVGIEVVSRATRARTEYGTKVPARAKMDVAYSSDGAGHYSSIATNDGQVFAEWGLNANDGRWSSLGAAEEWGLDFAKAKGVESTYVITQMDDRMDARPDVQANVDSALAQLLPTPISAWTNVAQKAGPGGTKIITAQAPKDASGCSYPSIKVVIKSGRIANTQWASKCPSSGTTTHTGTVTYEPGYESAPVSGATTQTQAFLLPDQQGRSAVDEAIAKAANATAATVFSNVSETSDKTGKVTNGLTVNQGLRLLDSLQQRSRLGIAREFALPSGGKSYLLTGSGTVGYWVTEGGLQIGGGTIEVGPDGIIKWIKLSTLGDVADSITTTFTR